MSDKQHQDLGGEEEQEPIYVQPNIEHELQKDKRQICRDIVKEIKDFGVNQRQILFIIQLLAMELENREVMNSLTKAVGEARKEIPVGNKLILPETPTGNKKLIF